VVITIIATMRNKISAVTKMPKQPQKDPQYDLKFLPQELVSSCRKLVDSFHAMHNFTCLADILWRAGVTDFVCINKKLEKAYAKAAKVRRAKRADTIYLEIASALLAIEILSNGLFGWSLRYPAAARRAIRLMDRYLSTDRVQLRDVYLCERNFVRRPANDFFRGIRNPPQVTGGHATDAPAYGSPLHSHAATATEAAL
jgi:hypothetical protein